MAQWHLFVYNFATLLHRQKFPVDIQATNLAAVTHMSHFFLSLFRHVLRQHASRISDHTSLLPNLLQLNITDRTLHNLTTETQKELTLDIFGSIYQFPKKKKATLPLFNKCIFKVQVFSSEMLSLSSEIRVNGKLNVKECSQINRIFIGLYKKLKEVFLTDFTIVCHCNIFHFIHSKTFL